MHIMSNKATKCNHTNSVILGSFPTDNIYKCAQCLQCCDWKYGGGLAVTKEPIVYIQIDSEMAKRHYDIIKIYF